MLRSDNCLTKSAHCVRMCVRMCVAICRYGSFQAESSGLASIPRQQLLGFARWGVRVCVFLHVRGVVRVRILAQCGRAGHVATLCVTVSSGVWTITLGGGPPSNAQYPGGGAVLVGKLEVA